MAKQSVVIAQTANVKRVWLRIPVAVEASGISRSRLYELIAEGKIRSASVRDRHKKKGVRLINADSLFGFIDSMATGRKMSDLAVKSGPQDARAAREKRASKSVVADE